MFEWWNSLGITMQVFYCIAIPATLIIVIQTILLMNSRYFYRAGYNAECR